MLIRRPAPSRRATSGAGARRRRSLRSWTLRQKACGLLAIVSVLPLLVVTALDLQHERMLRREARVALLEARVDQVSQTIEAMHHGYQAEARAVARDREVVMFCRRSPADQAVWLDQLRDRLDIVRGADLSVRGLGVVGLDGIVIASTEPALAGVSVAYRDYFQRAAAGLEATSDVYLSLAVTGSTPSIAYAVPVRTDAGAVVGVLLLWVRAQRMWDVMSAANGLAGRDSFFVLFDRHAVRIGHSLNPALLFHPAAPLPSQAATAMLATRRFQERTSELLNAVVPFPVEEFRGRYRAVFRRLSPTNAVWNLSVSRHLPALDWTLVMNVPEREVEVGVREILPHSGAACVVGLLLALAGGAIVMRELVGPIRLLAGAAGALERGQFAAQRRLMQLDVAARDEVGDLARAFLSMASALADRDRALRQRNEELQRVLETALEREKREREMQAELQQAQKLEAVARLAAGIAHEINTPIQFIGDNTRFLEEALAAMSELLRLHEEALAAAPVPPGVREELARAAERLDLDYLREHGPRSIQRTLEGLQRVATIVRAMKEFAHPDQKEMVATDLNRALVATLEVARNEYKYVADVETALGDLPLVTCHAGDLNQVFLNVIVNAAHAIADAARGTRGVIRIETRCDGDEVVVSISDTGGGIPEEIRDKIFDPFFTTKEVGRGTGQGLAIARNVVLKHEGAMTFDTKVGEGTTFHVRVPVVPATLEVATARAPEPAAPSS